MRKSLPLMLAATLLVLPGCVFAVGTGDDGDWMDEDGKLAKIEARLTTLEKHVTHNCTDACKLCKAEK